jgi:diadenosine tetraphosphate (Ap4A) HIT family hydrolase
VSGACVFCARIDQPAVLFETPALYVMADKYPLVAGHVLVISKSHRRCHAELPEEAVAELWAAAGEVRRFLREAYGTEALAWENGVFGQTVAHAHLHMVPVRAETLPPEFDRTPGIYPAETWEAVRACYDRHGGYRLMELSGDRRLIVDDPAALVAVQRWLTEVTGLEWADGDWVRRATPEDLRETERRWDARSRERRMAPHLGGEK